MRRMFTAAAALLFSGSAFAGPVTSTLTADNHYAVYTDLGGTLSLVGGNETGAAGSPGSYNWSMAETFNFDAGPNLYIAAWSDDAVAQGLLAEITINGDPVLSGDPRWQVFSTGIDIDTGGAYPTAPDVASQVQLADQNDLWVNPFVGGTNGMGPWGNIAGIDGDARWMWYPAESVGNPLTTGGNYDEYLIFRLDVPSPATGALAGACLIGLGMRRRRS